MTALFKLGRIVATQGAMGAFTQKQMTDCLDRHHAGDWGDLDIDDKAMNESAVETGADRILSAYKGLGDNELWIITEADRTITTLLLPAEY